MDPIEHLINEALSKVVTSTNCNICQVKIETPSVERQHFDSKRHKKNVASFKEQVRNTITNNLQKVKAPPLPKQNTTPPPQPLGVYKPPSMRNAKPSCKVCGETFDSQHEANSHYGTESHQRNVDCYCDICSIHTPSKAHMWTHLKAGKHKAQLKKLGKPPIDGEYSPFCISLSGKLQNEMHMDYCNICKIELPTIKRCVTHYISSPHKTAVGNFLKDKQVANQAAEQKLGNKFTKALEKVENYVATSKLDKTYFCFLCKSHFLSRNDENEHIQSFPHSIFIKEKLELLNKGISGIYLTANGSSITCELCQVTMYSLFVVTSHTNTERHIRNYLIWYENAKRVTEESEIKHFYCKVCDKGLTGTSSSFENHYDNESHAKKLNLYCQICDVSNANLELLKLHNKTTLHLENAERAQKKDSKSDISSKINPNNKVINETDISEEKAQSFSKNATINKLKDESEESGNLKNKVFNELEKLVQKLYYSKQVPYNLSFKYLKKVNKEVDEIINKKLNNESPNASNNALEIDGAGSDNLNANNDFKNEDVGEYNKSLQVAHFEKPNTVEDTNVTETLENNLKPVDDSNVTKTLKNNLKSASDNQIKLPLKNNIKIAKDFQQKLQRSVPEKGQVDPPHKPKIGNKDLRTPSKCISDLLKDIINRRQEVEGNADENDVLSEIEFLLKQIENIEEGPLLQDILTYLKDFNEELAEIDFAADEDCLHEELERENVAGENFQKLESNEFGTEEKTDDNEKIIAKSDKDFAADKDCLHKELKRENVAGENFQKLESNEFGTEEKTDSEKIIAKSGKDVKKCVDFVDFHQQGSIIADKSKEKTVVDEEIVNIYNYYSGNDFNRFMDFTEIYLQGSIKNLINEI